MQALQRRRGVVQRRLAGAHQQQPAVQIGADVFGDLLHVVGALHLVADELLDLVDDQQRAGQLAVVAKNLFDDFQSVVDGRRAVVLELFADAGLGIGRCGVLRVGGDECLGQRDGQLQAENFFGQIAALLLQCRLNLGLQPGRAQPQDEPGLGQVLGQAGSAQHQLDEGQAHVVHRAGAQRAGGGTQSAQRLGAVAQLGEHGADLGRQADQRARSGAVVEAVVLPQVAQHLDQVRLAAAEEATHPDGILFSLAQATEVGAEHAFHAPGVFAIANEVLQFEAQRLDLAGVVADFGDLRDAVVEQLQRGRVTEVQTAVGHEGMKLSVAVMGTAR